MEPHRQGGPDVAIRPGQARDAAAIARIHVESWRSTYAGLLPDDVLIGMRDKPFEVHWWRRVLWRPRDDHMVMVADGNPGGVLGFASGGPTRDPQLPFKAEVYALYLDDRYHGAGIGRALFGALSVRLAGVYEPSLLVWVLDGNPAQFFYEAMGGKRVAERTGDYRGAAIREIGYGWADATAMARQGRQDGG